MDMVTNRKQKIGLVIVNYNRGHLVKEMVELYLNYSCIDSIVIIDNVSSDQSLEILKSISDSKVKLFIQNENLGYAKGNNVGLRYLYDELQYEYAFIVNPDVYFNENVIKRIVDAFETHLDYAVISSARIDPDSKIPNLQYCKSYYGTYWQMLLSLLNVTRHFYLQKKYAVYDYDTSNHELQEVCVIPGSFFGIRLKYLKDIGYLDEGTFLYGEEQCLATKIERKGYKEGFVSDVIYEHRHIRNSTTTADLSLSSFKYNICSKLYYARKYMNLNILAYCFLRIVAKISLIEMYIIKRLKKFGK